MGVTAQTDNCSIPPIIQLNLHQSPVSQLGQDVPVRQRRNAQSFNRSIAHCANIAYHHPPLHPSPDIFAVHHEWPSAYRLKNRAQVLINRLQRGGHAVLSQVVRGRAENAEVGCDTPGDPLGIDPQR